METVVDFFAEKIVRNKIKKQFGGSLKSFISGGGALDKEIGRFLNIVHISNELTNTYKVTLATGKNREIRRVFDSLDCKVVKLKRIKYALVELSNLKVNKYRNLTKDEISNIIKYLKKY